mmetsp:Transcript_58853/g.156685  ORF Transcript_58853/g.156685 Transcript_58853/m.156685 type:complete len:262 (-) Transcript_58853:150-935(-)
MPPARTVQRESIPSPRGLRGGGDDAHPFDPAFGVMKAIQADLEELKVTLQNEQAQRVTEVFELRRVVLELREQLGKEKSDRITAIDRLTCALTAETGLRGKALDKLREDLSGAVKAVPEIEKVKTHLATSVGKLTNSLDEERRERMRKQDELYSSISNEVHAMTAQCGATARELSQLVDDFHATTHRETALFDQLALNVQSAGRLLSAGCDEKGSFEQDAVGIGEVDNALTSTAMMAGRTVKIGTYPDNQICGLLSQGSVS